MREAHQTPSGQARRFNGLVLAAVLFAGFSAVFFLSNAAEATGTPVPGSYIDEDLSLEGRRMKGFVFGAEGLIADFYWMQSLQYLGSKFGSAPADQVISLDDLTPLDPRLLYPYLDNATDLDPGFMAAYSYGATVLPAIDAETAIRFTEKGISNNPQNFRLYQYLGYIYWKLHRYDEAAAAYQRGAAQPGAPAFMRSMAAFMTGQAGSRETAREMYRQMIETGDQQTRSNAEYRLNEMDVEEQLEAINTGLEAVRGRTGACPRTLKEITSSLGSVKLAGGSRFRVNDAGDPVDPKAAPYVLDAGTCRASSTGFPNAGKKK